MTAEHSAPGYDLHGGLGHRCTQRRRQSRQLSDFHGIRGLSRSFAGRPHHQREWVEKLQFGGKFTER